MSRRKEVAISDLEECKYKINRLLKEYNCYLMSADEWSRVLLIDNDTQESVLAEEK